MFNSVSRLLKSKNHLLQYVDSASVLKRYNSQQSSTNTKREKWDLLSAVSLERKRIICRELNQLEKDMTNMLNKVEYEKSYKSDHEVKLITEKIKLEQFKKGDKLDMDSVPEKSAQDFEDAALEELNRFQFATRETIADKTNNRKSVERQLDRNLLLLVKDYVGKTPIWILPQGRRKDGETLRQTAERVLSEKCGTELKVDFFGNTPIGFYKYKYPKKLVENPDSAVGAKIFFFKAQWKEGDIKVGSKLEDYQWATRKELDILPKDYEKSVSLFLVNEEH